MRYYASLQRAPKLQEVKVKGPKNCITKSVTTLLIYLFSISSRSIFNRTFFSADSFSSALLVVSSKGEGEEGEGELFDKFFVAFVFPLKPGILALNQVVCLKASTWTKN